MRILRFAEKAVYFVMHAGLSRKKKKADCKAIRSSCEMISKKAFYRMRFRIQLRIAPSIPIPKTIATPIPMISSATSSAQKKLRA